MSRLQPFIRSVVTTRRPQCRHSRRRTIRPPQPDLVAILETVGHRLRGAVHFDRYAVDLVGLDTFRKGRPGKPGCSDGNHVDPRPVCLFADCNPYLRRILRGQLVEAKSGKKADDAGGHTPAHFGERLVLAPHHARHAVYPPGDTFEEPLLASDSEVLPRNTGGSHVGPMRPGSLTRQYKDRKNKTGGYWQISYTRQMKSRTEYVREEWVPEIRRQITTHKRFKRLIDQWIELDIERSKLTMQIAEPGANR